MLGEAVSNTRKSSNEDMISARIISSFDFKHRTSYNISFILERVFHQMCTLKLILKKTQLCHTITHVHEGPFRPQGAFIKRKQFYLLTCLKGQDKDLLCMPCFSISKLLMQKCYSHPNSQDR